MSATTSAATGRCFGIQRVWQVWERSRAALYARRARAHHRLGAGPARRGPPFADARDHPLAVGDGPGRPVDVQDVLIAQVHGISVGAGDPVELPEMPSLPMLKTDCLPS